LRRRRTRSPAAGNRTNTGYTLDGADALTNNYSATPFDSRGYDVLGNLASFNAREIYHTFDVHNRLTSQVLAGTRVEDDFSSSIPGVYTTQSGAWSVAGGFLHETTAVTGRILRDSPADMDEFTFSYRSPHDPDDKTDYDPERYGLAILRLLEPNSPAEWRYVALVIEPTGIFLREWQDDVLLGQLAASATKSDNDTWYDVKVEYSGTNNTTIKVSHAKSGEPFKTLFTVNATLAEDANQKLGFGVGELGEYEFKDIQFRNPTSTEDTVAATYQYDALGRRIAKTVYPGGTPTVTEYYYDGPRVIEERNGAGTVQATYVHGLYVDELITMNRASTDYYYHQDDLFNVMAVTNGSGTVVERYDYGEFGEPQFFNGSGAGIGGTAIGNAYLFNGREWDTTLGAYNYRSRYMDPKAGRFLSRDTIGLWGDANNLGNGQAYVGNNPWSSLDPFGRATDEETIAAYRALYGGEGEHLADVFGRAGGSVSIQDRSWWQSDWSYSNSGLAITIDASLDPIASAQAVFGGLQKAFTYSRVNQYLLDEPNDLPAYGAARQRAVAESFNIASQGAQFYLSGLTTLNEGADWAIAIEDLTNGRWESILAMAPFISAGMVKGGRILVKQGDDVAISILAKSGGRHGGKATQELNVEIADWLAEDGYEIIGGGGYWPETYLRGTGRGTRGGNFADITVTRDGQIFYINTISTLADGVTPTVNEARAAAKIRAKLGQNESLLLVPKRKR
jgi:RHS repeat-associated protein